MKLIEKIAKELERHDCRGYGWTQKQFDVWWEKDPRAAHARTNQRARAKMLIKKFDLGVFLAPDGWDRRDV